jgi:GNAT superfamily N-acetyltransferase
MKREAELHVVPKRALLPQGPPLAWSDPEGLTEPPAHIRRMLVGNPLSTSDDDPVEVIATVGDCVAGRVYVLPGELRVEGDPVPALWGFDLMVSPRFRGMGLATKVVKCWHDQADTVLGNAINAISEAIYPRLGCTMFYTPARQLICRSQKFLQSYLRFGPGAGAASVLLDSAQRARRQLLGFWRPGHTRGLRAERVDRMSPEFDRALARQMAPVMAHRSAKWINWMLGCPEPDERGDFALYYVRDEEDRVVGYFILSRICPPLLRNRFENVTIGAVKDWMSFDEAEVDHLSIVLLGLRELMSWRVDVLMAVLPGFDDADIRVLRKFGFTSREHLRTSFLSLPSGPLAAEEYRRRENWWLPWANSDGLFL